jgi:hypothetical protein
MRLRTLVGIRIERVRKNRLYPQRFSRVDDSHVEGKRALERTRIDAEREFLNAHVRRRSPEG